MKKIVFSWRYLWSRPLAAALNLLLLSLGLASIAVLLLGDAKLGSGHFFEIADRATVVGMPLVFQVQQSRPESLNPNRLNEVPGRQKAAPKRRKHTPRLPRLNQRVFLYQFLVVLLIASGLIAGCAGWVRAAAIKGLPIQLENC